LADLSARRGDSWFVALPDCAAADAAAQSFLGPEVQRVAHPSGRPWLVGRWPAGTLVLGGDGDRRSARIGEPPGSCHLVTAGGDEISVRGTASGLRRVFHTRVGGVAVAGDQARVLVAATRAEPDPVAVAALLLAPEPPYPLSEWSLWQGVAAVPPDHRLTVAGEGPARTSRWWRPPEPAAPLAEGAARLRERLRAAVRLRVQAAGNGRISADLSGGLDSTALCFLAAEAGADLVTLRVAPIDPGNDDPRWAAYAGDRLPGDHLVLDPSDVLAEAAVGVAEFGPAEREAPVGGLLARVLLTLAGRRLAGYGSRLHLVGHGGDEVTGVSRAYLRALFPRRPMQALRQLRAHRSIRAWPLAASVRALADPRSYPAWLAGLAGTLRDPRSPADRPQLGWGGAVRLPGWATGYAAELVAGALTAAAHGVVPLAASRAQHRAVTAVWSASRTARRVGRAMSGVPVAAPFLDDEVVAAALSVDLAVRGQPWRYKPLLSEALAPVLPPALLERRTKGAFAAEGIAGLRRYRAALLGLCEDLELARLGLVDPAALRAAGVGLDPTGQVSMAVESTVAAELWLRAQRVPAGGGQVATG
jgi:asparagine synthase (glutamine-hydrolysing)